MPRLALVALALAATPRLADANASCAGETDWVPSATGVVEPHGDVLFYTDRVGITDWKPPTPHATLDGVDVPITVTPIVSGPFKMLLVHVDTSKTGKLALTFDKGIPYVGKPDATFTVAATSGRVADKATAVVATFHHEIKHTTVEEIYDGLALHLDVNALYVTVRWRRDADAAWQTVDVPIMVHAGTPLAAPGALLGKLGCATSIEPAMLRAGVDVQVTAHLANGKVVPVALDKLTL